MFHQKNRWVEVGTEAMAGLEYRLAKTLHTGFRWLTRHSLVRLSGYFLLTGVIVLYDGDGSSWAGLCLRGLFTGFLTECLLGFYHIIAIHRKISDHEEDLRELREMDLCGLLDSLTYFNYLHHIRLYNACTRNRIILLILIILSGVVERL